MSAAAGVFLERGDFAAGHCRECRRDVLSYPDAPAGDVRRCLHCDERLVGELRWVDVADLGGLGYEVEVADPAGTGCTSCASGCAVKTVTDETGA